jgi:hypothetical protein
LVKQGVQESMEGSRFGTWLNDLSIFVPTSDPPQIVATGGSRELFSAMFVMGRIGIHLRDRPTPHRETFPGAAC